MDTTPNRTCLARLPGGKLQVLGPEDFDTIQAAVDKSSNSFFTRQSSEGLLDVLFGSSNDESIKKMDKALAIAAHQLEAVGVAQRVGHDVERGRDDERAGNGEHARSGGNLLLALDPVIESCIQFDEEARLAEARKDEVTPTQWLRSTDDPRRTTSASENAASTIVPER